MYTLKFKIDEYNLNFTLKPSFVSSLYERKSPFHWIKIAGLYAKEISFKQINDFLEVYTNCNNKELILYESGLWDEKPSSRISKLSGSLKEQIKALSELFPGVRLSIAPHEFNCIFIAVILSKRTNYEVFVRKWMKNIWNNWQCNPSIIAKLKDIKNIGTSYQLIDLIKTMNDYLKINHLSKNEEEARRILMLCWGVGPKIADATLLFTRKAPWIVPCDVHLQRISRRLGWIDYKIRLPLKYFCLKYYCDECISKYGPCLKEEIKRLFPGFGGWIQTLTYLFGNTICKSINPKCKLCHSILREYCYKFSKNNNLR
ncbi:MAG: hypothetical protein QXW62_02710 [Candidatus Methanomethylicaceae archaeon]|nr:hypothetical protein [Candidatus Verstraetearchaeota archaeon]